MLWPCYHYRDEINCSNILADRSCVLTCDILIVRKPIKRSNPLAFYKFAIVVISLFSGPHVTLMRFFNHRGSNLSLLIGVWRQNCVCFIVASTHLVWNRINLPLPSSNCALGFSFHAANFAWTRPRSVLRISNRHSHIYLGFWVLLLACRREIFWR